MPYVEMNLNELPEGVEMKLRIHCGRYNTDINVKQFLENMQNEFKKFGGKLNPAARTIEFKSQFHYELFLLKWI